MPAPCTHRRNAFLPSWSSHSSEQGGQGRRCQAPPRGELVRHLWRVPLWFLLLGDQACYCPDSQSRFGDGMGLVPEWAVPGPTPCRRAEGGSVERKARALTLLPAHLPPVPSFSSWASGWTSTWKIPFSLQTFPA